MSSTLPLTVPITTVPITTVPVTKVPVTTTTTAVTTTTPAAATEPVKKSPLKTISIVFIIIIILLIFGLIFVSTTTSGSFAPTSERPPPSDPNLVPINGTIVTLTEEEQAALKLKAQEALNNLAAGGT